MEMSKLQNGIWISRMLSGDYEMLKINVRESLPDLGRKEPPQDNEANEDSPSSPPALPGVTVLHFLVSKKGST